MFRSQYYDAMKLLAAEKRLKYSISTASLGLKRIREVYKAEGVAIDLWETSYKIRAMYMCDGGDPSVLVNRNLPTEPRIFAMVHELKHHYCDQTALKNGQIRCGDYNANEVIEKAAEVFAAEFIYPAQEFWTVLPHWGWRLAKSLLKRSCSSSASAKLPSVTSFFRNGLSGLASSTRGQFAKVQFQKLEEEIYGVPIYRQQWFRARRRRRG